LCVTVCGSMFVDPVCRNCGNCLSRHPGIMESCPGYRERLRLGRPSRVFELYRPTLWERLVEEDEVSGECSG